MISIAISLWLSCQVDGSYQFFKTVVDANSQSEGFRNALQFKKKFSLTPQVERWIADHKFSKNEDVDVRIFAATQGKPNDEVTKGAFQDLKTQSRNTSIHAFEYLLSISKSDEKLRQKAIQAAMARQFLPNPGGYFESALKQFKAWDAYEKIKTIP